MRLFIAEKPSLARAIAEALPGPQRRSGDSIICGNEDVVAWCAGHILETAPPDAYAPEYKTWRLEDLPIVPKEWKLQVSTPGLLKSIRSLLKSADRVVHAGDPDREGQLLVDEVIQYLGYRGPVDRLLINDLRPEAVRQMLGRLEPNQRYRPLYESALARQRADWLFGMNMTRLYTILGRNGGYDGVLSVGRVQTPLLGLIVRRDLDIEHFRPVAYYQVVASFETKDGATFRATWTPGESPEAFLDDEKRLLSQELAEAVRDRTSGVAGTVAERTEEKKTEAPPLPFSLADLQVEAGKKLGLSAAKVLEACQGLYETHRLITYPRSDCSYLPEGHFAQAKDVLAAIARNVVALDSLMNGADVSIRSKAWNDKKVTAHHAIIPTVGAIAGKLTESERVIYEAIARRYMLQFYNVYSYTQTRLTLVVAEERFSATGRRIQSMGWKGAMNDAPGDDDSDARDEAENASLPDLQKGDTVTARTVSISDKKTTPPKRFTDASLIQAMCNVARFVKSSATKKILTETDGIGTPATRAAIIETLLERGYVERQKKTILSTTTGRALIAILPDVATTPDMTATWEAAIRAIGEGERTLDAFLGPVSAALGGLVEQGRKLGRLQIGDTHSCTKPPCTGHLRRLRGKGGFFWSCNECRATTNDSVGQPVKPGESAVKDRPPGRGHVHKRQPSGRRGR